MHYFKAQTVRLSTHHNLAKMTEQQYQNFQYLQISSEKLSERQQTVKSERKTLCRKSQQSAT